MQAPDAWPGKDEVKHDCFQPQLQGYDGEYGRPHEAECQKCISISYSIERLNEFGYKVGFGLLQKEVEHEQMRVTESHHELFIKTQDGCSELEFFHNAIPQPSRSPLICLLNDQRKTQQKMSLT